MFLLFYNTIHSSDRAARAPQHVTSGRDQRRCHMLLSQGITIRKFANPAKFFCFFVCCLKGKTQALLCSRLARFPRNEKEAPLKDTGLRRRADSDWKRVPERGNMEETISLSILKLRPACQILRLVMCILLCNATPYMPVHSYRTGEKKKSTQRR